VKHENHCSDITVNSEINAIFLLLRKM